MPSRELSLADVFRVLRKHGLWMLVVSLLAGAAAYGLTFLLPVLYRSQALIVVNSVGTELPLNEPDMETWRDLVLSRNTAQRVVTQIKDEGLTIEAVRKQMQALLTKRVSRDVPYARNLNLTYDARSPATSQKFMSAWLDTASQIGDEMAQQQIERLRNHFAATYNESQKEAAEAETNLTKFRGENPLAEARVRQKVVQDALTGQRGEYEAAFADTRIQETHLTALQSGFQSYFAAGRWVGELTAAPNGHNPTTATAPFVRQMAAARREYLDIAKKLEQMKSLKRVTPTAERLRAVTETIGALGRALADEKSSADSLAQAVAGLEKDRPASGAQPLIQIHRAPSNEAFLLSPPDQRADLLKGKAMMGEELNPQYFAVENLLSQNRDLLSKSRAKVQSIEQQLRGLRQEEDALNRAVVAAQQEQTGLELQLQGSTERYQESQRVFNQIAAEISSVSMQLELSRIKRDVFAKNIANLETQLREAVKTIAELEQTEHDLTVRSDKSQEVLGANTQKLFLYNALNTKKIGLLSVGSPASYPKEKIWPPRTKIALGVALLTLFVLGLANLLRESIGKGSAAA